MNLPLTILPLLILMTGSAAAQTYVFVNGGYNTDVGGLTIIANRTSVYRSTSGSIEYTNSFEKIDASFGKGYVIAGGIGRHWNGLITTEIAAELHTGGSYTGTLMYEMYVDANEHGSYLYTTSWNYRSVNIVPSLLVRMAEGTVSPFVRIGAILSFPDIEYLAPSTNEPITHVFSGNFGYGMIGAIGASVRSIGGTELWLDIHYASANWSPAKEEYTDADGVKKTFFLKDSYTEPPHLVNYGPTSTSLNKISRNIPMAYIGLSAGIRLMIGGSEPESPE